MKVLTLSVFLSFFSLNLTAQCYSGTSLDLHAALCTATLDNFSLGSPAPTGDVTIRVAGRIIHSGPLPYTFYPSDVGKDFEVTSMYPPGTFCTTIVRINPAPSCFTPAPTITAPTAGQVMDNACPAEGNQTIWNFSWTSVNGNAQPYNLVVERLGGLAPQVNVVVTGNSYTYTSNLNFGGTGWRVKVRARSSDGVNYGPFSTPVPFNIEPLNTDCRCLTIIPPPTPTAVYNAADNSAAVSWAAVPGVFGYFLDVFVRGLTTIETIPVTTNSVNLSSLIRGTDYTFLIRIRCTPTITSQFSPPGFLSTPCPSSPSVSVQFNSTENAATVSWAAAVAAVAYLVEYRPVGSTQEWASSAFIPPTSTSANVTGLIGGLDYEFRLNVYCRSGNSYTYAGSPVSIPCVPVTGGYVSDITTNAATLNWTAVSGALSYNVISEDGVMVATVSGSSYKATGLLPDNTYGYSIVPHCTDGAGFALSFTTLPSPTPLPCLAPNFSITNIKATSAIVAWNPVAGARSYRVNYKLTTESEWKTLTTTANKATIEGLTPRDGGDHTYQVQVLSICSNSSESTPSVSTPFETKSSCPEIDPPVVTYVNYSLANVAWNAEPNATDGYLVEYYLLPFEGAALMRQTTATNNAVLRDLLPNRDYAVRIRTQCGVSAFSQFSLPTAFRTIGIFCTTPIRLRTANISSNSATASWGNVPMAVGYEVSYKKSTDETWTSFNVVATGTNLTALTPATPYNFRVRSLCPFGNNSEWSITHNFETPAGATANTGLENTSVTGVVKNKEAFSYDIQLSPNPTNGQLFLVLQTEKELPLNLSVTNRLGQVVMQQKIDRLNKGNTSLNLDLSHLPNDIYLLQAFDGHTYKSKKIVVMH